MHTSGFQILWAASPSPWQSFHSDEGKKYISGLHTKEGAPLIPEEIPATMPNLTKKNLQKKKKGRRHKTQWFPYDKPLHKVNKCTHYQIKKTLSLYPHCLWLLNTNNSLRNREKSGWWEKNKEEKREMGKRKEWIILYFNAGANMKDLGERQSTENDFPVTIIETVLVYS